jgi:hypothetical protein
MQKQNPEYIKILTCQKSSFMVSTWGVCDYKCRERPPFFNQNLILSLKSHHALKHHIHCQGQGFQVI